MESDVRYYRRRANEELAAASRAVTQAAKDRRMQLAGIFLERLKTLESSRGSPKLNLVEPSAFNWTEGRSARA